MANIGSSLSESIINFLNLYLESILNGNKFKEGTDDQQKVVIDIISKLFGSVQVGIAKKLIEDKNSKLLEILDIYLDSILDGNKFKEGTDDQQKVVIDLISKLFGSVQVGIAKKLIEDKNSKLLKVFNIYLDSILDGNKFKEDTDDQQKVVIDIIGKLFGSQQVGIAKKLIEDKNSKLLKVLNIYLDKLSNNGHCPHKEKAINVLGKILSPSKVMEGSQSASRLSLLSNKKIKEKLTKLFTKKHDEEITDEITKIGLAIILTALKKSKSTDNNLKSYLDIQELLDILNNKTKNGISSEEKKILLEIICEISKLKQKGKLKGTVFNNYQITDKLLNALTDAYSGDKNEEKRLSRIAKITTDRPIEASSAAPSELSSTSAFDNSLPSVLDDINRLI